MIKKFFTQYSSRERFLNSINHIISDRIPLSFFNGFSPGFIKKVRNKGIKKDLFKYFHADSRRVFPELIRKKGYQQYYPDYDPETYNINVFGNARIQGSKEHFTKPVFPLKNACSISDIKKYPLPDIDNNNCYKKLKKEVENYHKQGSAVIGHCGNLFETAWQIRGMEEFLADFYVHPEWSECLLDRLMEIKMRIIPILIKSGVDVVHFGDDVGTQIGMMMAPETWRTFLKIRLIKLINQCKKVKNDIPISYHSDGDISIIIPDLIEIGVNILNPVQPECLDIEKIKNKYGKDITLWGTVGIQKLLPFGKPEEVKEAIQFRIKKLGYNGGLILGPTHKIEPEVPIENVETMVETVMENKL